MISARRKNKLRGNHLILDVQRKKEGHQFIIMMNTLASQQQSIQPSPTTLKKALQRDHAENWKAAAHLEYQSLLEN